MVQSVTKQTCLDPASWHNHNKAVFLQCCSSTTTGDRGELSARLLRRSWTWRQEDGEKVSGQGEHLLTSSTKGSFFHLWRYPGTTFWAPSALDLLSPSSERCSAQDPELSISGKLLSPFADNILRIGAKLACAYLWDHDSSWITPLFAHL